MSPSVEAVFSPINFLKFASLSQLCIFCPILLVLRADIANTRVNLLDNLFHVAAETNKACSRECLSPE